ncbi:NIPA [Mytilus edulis]|uniref:NIPA n=1 Tax=Mytilus edulis TaxID=6550 RepID=A0A8S3RU69_MYTED|nr:NIPA [Mytilus edulis]
MRKCSGLSSNFVYTMSYNNTTQPSILNVTEETLHQVSEADIYGFWIGFSLAIFSNAFTGSSYIVKKLGLNRVAKKQEGVLPDHDGYGYLKEWLWWVGMSLMIFGEILNFLAYIFAPATLVTPLGALSVIVTAVMSSIFLKERLNIIGKVSCGLCVIGSTVMVVHSPQETQVHSMDEMLEKVQEPIFIVYCLTLLGVALVFIIILAPKYGGKYVLVYQAICGILGSFTVMGSKGTGIAISQTVKGDQQFTNWFTYVNLAIVIACILVELNFLNRSLAKFNTAVVIPINYVLFTSFVVSLSAVLFKDFFYMNWKDIVSFFLGFIIVVGGIFLLNSFKDMDITMKNLPKAHKKEIEKDETINILVNGNIKNTNDTYRKLDNSQSIASIDQIVFETK